METCRNIRSSSSSSSSSSGMMFCAARLVCQKMVVFAPSNVSLDLSIHQSWAPVLEDSGADPKSSKMDRKSWPQCRFENKTERLHVLSLTRSDDSFFKISHPDVAQILVDLLQIYSPWNERTWKLRVGRWHIILGPGLFSGFYLLVSGRSSTKSSSKVPTAGSKAHEYCR